MHLAHIHAAGPAGKGSGTAAMCGGVNFMHTADASGTLARAGMLAPDGRCKTLDARADGYSRWGSMRKVFEALLVEPIHHRTTCLLPLDLC